MPRHRRAELGRPRRQAVEQRIMDATEALLGERMFGELIVEDVMALTGLTRTTFYRYFPDLEAVVTRMGLRVWAGFPTLEWFLESDEPGDIRSRLLATASEFARHYRDNGGVLTAFAEAAATSGAAEGDWVAVIERFVAVHSSRFHVLNQRGITQIRHPEETARALVGMTERYIGETVRAGRDVTADPVVETLADLWYRSVFSPENVGAHAAVAAGRGVSAD